MISRLLVEVSLSGYDTFADVTDYASSAELPNLPADNAVHRR
jgi:hypothetical protein